MEKIVSDQNVWLSNNESLRMDANSDLFNADRRLFHLDRYEFAKSYCSGKRVLDGACGTGYGSAILSGVAREVIGIDCSIDAILYASEKYANDVVSFQRSFVEMSPFSDASFDVVTSFETVEHTLCPQAHMSEIVRLLSQKTGCAIVSAPNDWGLTDHHFFDFNATMLKELVDQFFSRVSFFYQNPRNSQRMPGIGPLQSEDPADAQCIIAVCEAPKKDNLATNRCEMVMDEIYNNVFSRHQEFLTLSYRQNTSFLKRAMDKLRTITTQGDA
jgi:2-polyprenyl-3-methyl-5-hydroxy-6-metoxy-1,4-benzoquinol methylase